jgi:dynein heavy chain
MHQLLEVEKKKDEILDTHATNWHDDFDKFRNAIKDMEKKCCNIIDSAFVNQKSIRECLFLINNFYNISHRQSIKDHLKTKVLEKI